MRARGALPRDARVDACSRQSRGRVLRGASPHDGHVLGGGTGRARAGPVEGGVVPFVAAAVAFFATYLFVIDRLFTFLLDQVAKLFGAA